MEDSEPYQNFGLIFTILRPESFDVGVIIGFVTILFLLIVSALVSGSEVAFFSLLPTEIEKLRDQGTKNQKRIFGLS